MSPVKQPEDVFSPPDQLFRAIGYIVKNPIQVSAFLGSYPFFGKLLPSIKSKIETYFGDAPVYLEVTSDPEIPGDVILEVAISPLDEPAQALKKLRQLDQDWWLEAMDETQDKLDITLEYK